MRRASAGAVLAAAVLAGAGCGGSSSGSGRDAAAPLAWTRAPKVFRPATLPSDRVAIGTIRNTSSKSLALTASRIVVRDAAGHRLISTVQFASGYAHGLYGAYQKPSPIPPKELRRLGLVISLPAGRTAPLTVSWHLPKDAKLPATVDYGAGHLTLPVRARPGAPGV